jgi:hypothetical protein
MKIRGQTVYPLKERLERLSKPVQSGCIEWQSSTRNGYGRLIIGSRTDGTRSSVSAHRLSYEIHVGKIPDGFFVCHTCDNPKCINPDHLFVGTRQDNTDDREAKGRNKIHLIHRKGEEHPSAKFSDKVIVKIRSEAGSVKEIAMKYGMSERHVRDIRKNKYRQFTARPAKGE